MAGRSFRRIRRRRRRSAPNGAAGTPEGRRLGAGVLVHVMVHEIAVLGDEVRLARGVVVGADHGVQFRVGGEQALDHVHRVGLDDDIGVDEEQQVANSGACPDVARLGWPGWAGSGDHRGAVLPGHVRRVRGAAIDDHDQRRQAPQAAGKPVVSGTDRNDCRNDERAIQNLTPIPSAPARRTDCGWPIYVRRWVSSIRRVVRVRRWRRRESSRQVTCRRTVG